MATCHISVFLESPNIMFNFGEIAKRDEKVIVAINCRKIFQSAYSPIKYVHLVIICFTTTFFVAHMSVKCLNFVNSHFYIQY